MPGNCRQAIISYPGESWPEITSFQKNAEKARESLGDVVDSLDTALLDGRSSPEEASVT